MHCGPDRSMLTSDSLNTLSVNNVQISLCFSRSEVSNITCRAHIVKHSLNSFTAMFVTTASQETAVKLFGVQFYTCTLVSVKRSGSSQICSEFS